MRIALNKTWLAYPRCVHSAFHLTHLNKERETRNAADPTARGLRCFARFQGPPAYCKAAEKYQSTVHIEKIEIPMFLRDGMFPSVSL